MAYLDGCKRCSTNEVLKYVDNGLSYYFGFGGYRTPGWHVIAKQGYGNDAGYICRRIDDWGGGGRYAELLIWNRTLTEDEVMVAQAYLANKWFGKSIPGYAATSEPGEPNLARVSVVGETEFAVGGGDHVKIGTLAAAAPLVKSGTGTLYVETAMNDDVVSSSLDLRGGGLELTGTKDVSAKCEMAREPALHFDPSQTNKWRIIDTGTAKKINWWEDLTGKNGGFAVFVGNDNSPLLDTVNTQNGLPVVDFGSLASSRWFTLCKPIESAYHCYAVCNIYRGGVIFGSNPRLGKASGYTYYDWHRATWGAGSGLLLSTAFYNWNGVVTNGVPTNGECVPTDEMQLFEFHQSQGTHISGMCIDRNIPSRSGGAIAGEMIVYDRPLTEREKVATRNYLMNKWFGKTDAELTNLPAATVTESYLPALKVSSSTTIGIAAPAKTLRLVGEGTFTKTGAGTLAINDLTTFTGKVAVAAGAVKLPRASTPSAAVVENGRILHVDATQSLNTYTNSSGIFVTRMNSLVGDGVYALANSASGYEKPQLVDRTTVMKAGLPDLAAGLCAIDLLPGETYKQFFVFMKNGETNEITGIRSVYWVIGSKRGGGWLLGGGRDASGTPYRYAWHRGDSTGTGSGTGDSYNQSLVGGAANECVRFADWMVNDMTVQGYGTGAATLSGGWDLVSMRVKDTYATAPTADGLAFDGRILDPAITENFWNRCGQQMIGEIIIYNRRLTDEEDAANRAYLAAKWGFAQPVGENGVEIELAANTALDCGDKRQYLAAISGAGVVTNGTLTAAKLIYDFSEGSFVTADAFTVPETLTVEFANMPNKNLLIGNGYTVLKATVIEGLSNLRTAVFTGDAIPGGVRARLRATASGELQVLFMKDGLMVLFK